MLIGGGVAMRGAFITRTLRASGMMRAATRTRGTCLGSGVVAGARTTTNTPPGISMPLVGQLWPLEVHEEQDVIIYKQSNINDIAGLQDALTALQNGNGSGVDKTYTHVQSSPANAWVVNHNLGKNPSVTVIDSGGTEVWTDIVHNNINQCVVFCDTAFGGTAICN